MAIKVIIAIIVVLGAVIIYAATRPAEFKIERSVQINAAPELIFPYFNSPRLFDSINPFLKQDPKVELKYSGPEAGVGAKSSWDSKTQAGVGTVTIVESVPLQKVRVQLDFEKPFKGTNYGQYDLKSTGSGTQVTWSMTGTNGLFQRVFCLFINMDKMVGGEFEKGLAEVKQRAESGKPTTI